MNNLFRAEPVSAVSEFSLPGKIVWCGSMAQDETGKCHLFYSYWDESRGFDQAWATDSRIAYASADNPAGPYKPEKTILPNPRGDDAWDRDVAHNPTVLYWRNKFYLYYMGNFGNGEYWDHRNHQNIGVASASSPTGEWKTGKPLLESPGAVMFSNPTVCRCPDGRFMMIYKWVLDQGAPPFYGPVRHGVAVADHPEGPFQIINDNIFAAPGAAFPCEDPFLFVVNDTYYCILKDNATYFSPLLRALVMFESSDGVVWRNLGAVLSRDVAFENRGVQEIFRLERPQVSFCNDGRIRLFCALKPSENAAHAYSANISVSPFIFEKEGPIRTA
jgi:hypothetical protein